VYQLSETETAIASVKPSLNTKFCLVVSEKMNKKKILIEWGRNIASTDIQKHNQRLAIPFDDYAAYAVVLSAHQRSWTFLGRQEIGVMPAESMQYASNNTMLSHALTGRTSNNKRNGTTFATKL
jgi:hypothetical protein